MTGQTPDTEPVTSHHHTHQTTINCFGDSPAMNNPYVYTKALTGVGVLLQAKQSGINTNVPAHTAANTVMVFKMLLV